MGLMRRVRNLFLRKRLEREIADEVAAHLALRAEDNVAEGMTERAARRDARVRFGNPVVVRERTAGMDAELALAGIWADVRYAARQLGRSRMYAGTAIVTLGLAIGTNTAVFSVVHTILLRQLPFADPSRVFHVENADVAGLEIAYGSKSYRASFNAAAQSFKTIEGAAMYASSGANVELGNRASKRVEATEVNAGFFSVLGVQPQVGRGFGAKEDVPGQDHVVVISDRFWRENLQADPAAIGRVIHINAFAFTVIGVMPPKMDFPEKSELWTPTIFDEATFLREGGAFYLTTIVRARQGASLEQLRDEFKARVMASHRGQSMERMPMLTPIEAELTRSIRASLWMLTGAALLVLLGTCANLAGLMLVRSGLRRGEFAVRAALGAARSRLMRQVLVESTMIALGGGALGVGVGFCVLRLLMVFRPAVLRSFEEPTLDGGVLAFTFAVSLITGLVFGLVPGWRAAREAPVKALKHGVWRTSRSDARLRKTLVGSEVALAIVLAAGAGLLLRTMATMNAVPLGFTTRGIVTFSVAVHGGPYMTDEGTTPALSQYYSRILQRVSSLPGVAAAAAVSSAPLDTRADMLLPISAGAGTDAHLGAAPRFVSAGYFGTMGIPVLEGRDFAGADTRTSPRVVIVTRDVAEKLWPGQSPIGKTLHCPWYCKDLPTVVGVVAGDRRFGPRSQPLPEYSMPYMQQDWPYMTFIVRTAGDASEMAAEIRRAAGSVDATQPVYDVTTMQQRLNDNESLVRFELYVLGVFAVLAGVLAVVGLHGLIAFAVMHRSREIGLRIALGAQRTSIGIGVLGEALRVTTIGSLIGIGVVLACGRLLRATLYGVTSHDPWTLVAVPLGAILATLVASLAPAWRAASVNPVEALRME